MTSKAGSFKSDLCSRYCCTSLLLAQHFGGVSPVLSAHPWGKKGAQAPFATYSQPPSLTEVTSAGAGKVRCQRSSAGRSTTSTAPTARAMRTADSSICRGCPSCTGAGVPCCVRVFMPDHLVKGPFRPLLSTSRMRPAAGSAMRSWTDVAAPVLDVAAAALREFLHRSGALRAQALVDGGPRESARAGLLLTPRPDRGHRRRPCSRPSHGIELDADAPDLGDIRQMPPFDVKPNGAR